MAAKKTNWAEHTADMYRKVYGTDPPKPERKRRKPTKAAPRVATLRQGEILDAVLALTRETGKAPSAADVGARLGISKQSALRQLQAIAAKGLVSDLPKMVSSGHWQVIGDERSAARPSR